MPVLSSVGRGTSSISPHLEAALGEQPPIFLDRGKEPGRDQRGSPPRSAPTARIAVAMAATLP